MPQRILIADDSLGIRERAAAALRARGYEVTTVADGEQARSALAQGSWALVMLDAHLARVDGLSLCREAKSQEPDRPVLLVVGTFEPLDPVRAEECGADAILHKPWAEEELSSTLEPLLGPAQEPPDASAEPPASEPTAAAEAPVGERESIALSESDVDRIARRVFELIEDEIHQRLRRPESSGEDSPRE